MKSTIVLIVLVATFFSFDLDLKNPLEVTIHSEDRYNQFVKKHQLIAEYSAVNKQIKTNRAHEINTEIPVGMQSGLINAIVLIHSEIFVNSSLLATELTHLQIIEKYQQEDQMNSFAGAFLMGNQHFFMEKLQEVDPSDLELTLKTFSKYFNYHRGTSASKILQSISISPQQLLLLTDDFKNSRGIFQHSKYDLLRKLAFDASAEDSIYEQFIMNVENKSNMYANILSYNDNTGSKTILFLSIDTDFTQDIYSAMETGSQALTSLLPDLEIGIFGM